MAEQLGLEQLVGQRAAVDRDEGPAASARAVRMAREHLLAGARLAGDQHRRAEPHRGFGQFEGGDGLGIAQHDVRLGGEDGGSRLARPWRRRRGHRAARRRPCHATRHQGAAQHVAQAHVGAAMQPRHHELHRFAEQFLESGAAQREALQDRAAARVVRQHAAVAVERQQARAERAQELRARVDRQHQVVAHLVGEQPVLHLRGGHLHQRLRVMLARLEVRRGVEHADDLALRVAHRRRAARDVAQSEEIVLQPAHRGGTPAEQCGAGAVGAADALAPVAAHDDAGARAAHLEAVVGEQVEDDAVGIGEREQEVRARDLLRQRLQLGLREPPHDGGALAAPRELVRLDDVQRRRAGEVQPGFEATRPAVEDLAGRHAVGRQGAAAGAQDARMGQLALGTEVHAGCLRQAGSDAGSWTGTCSTGR